MKELKNTKKIKKEVNSLTQLIELHCDEINKDHMKQMIRLLKNIAIGENLNYEELKLKYLKKHDDIITSDTNIPADIVDIKIESKIENDVILDKVTHNNTSYYVDKINNITYDSSFNKVDSLVNTTLVV